MKNCVFLQNVYKIYVFEKVFKSFFVAVCVDFSGK